MCPVFWRAERVTVKPLHRAALLIKGAAAELQRAKALIGRAFVVAVALGFPIISSGGTIPLSPFLSTGAVAVAMSLVTSVSWFKKGRLDGLALLPFTAPAIVAAACAVGAVSSVVSDAAPLALAFGLVGMLSPAGAAAACGLGMLAAGAAFLCGWALRRLEEALRGKWLPALFHGLGRSRGRLARSEADRAQRTTLWSFARKLRTSNYLLEFAMHDSGVWLSLAGMTFFGWASTDILLSKGFAIPVFSICYALTPPLATLLSRDLHTRRQLLILEEMPSIVRQYVLALLALIVPLIAMGNLVMALLGRPVGIAFAVESIVAYLAATTAIVILEIRFPRLNWKTESEMYLHPRRYAPALAAAVVVGIFWLAG